MQEPETIQIGKETKTFKITYKMALIDLPEKGLYLLNLLEGDNVAIVVEKLHTNNLFMIEMMNYLLFDDKKNMEEMAELLDGNNGEDLLEEFRQKFWNQAINFTPPQLRDPLNNMIEQAMNNVGTAAEEQIQALQEQK